MREVSRNVLSVVLTYFKAYYILRRKTNSFYFLYTNEIEDMAYPSCYIITLLKDTSSANGCYNL